MKKTITKSLKVTSAITAFCVLCISALQAQTIISNSLVTYTYDVPNPLVPNNPIAPVTGDVSTLSFLPANFGASVVGSGFMIDTESGVVGVLMEANPGLYFDGSILMTLNAKAPYNIFASPQPGAYAGALFSAPFTLYITEVDGSPFAYSVPEYESAMTVSPASVSVGPGGFMAGNFNASLSLDLNTVKSHFSLAPGQNITGMRLQALPSITAYANNGSANASVVNFDIQSTVVPEPSTYALFMLGSAAGGFALWRRRRRG